MNISENDDLSDQIVWDLGVLSMLLKRCQVRAFLFKYFYSESFVSSLDRPSPAVNGRLKQLRNYVMWTKRPVCVQC